MSGSPGSVTSIGAACAITTNPSTKTKDTKKLNFLHITFLLLKTKQLFFILASEPKHLLSLTRTQNTAAFVQRVRTAGYKNMVHASNNFHIKQASKIFTNPVLASKKTTITVLFRA
jgi:hypothetical protein